MSDTVELHSTNGSRTASPETDTTEGTTRTNTPVNSSREAASGAGPTSDTSEFDFIKSPLKRQYFRDNLLQTQSGTPAPAPTMTQSGQPDGENHNGPEGTRTGHSPTPKEVSFTPPPPVIPYAHGVKATNVSSTPHAHAAVSPTSNKGGSSALEAQFIVPGETERPYQPTTTPLYTKSQFESSIEKFIGSSNTNGNGSGGGSMDPEKGHTPEYKVQYLPDDNVKEALLAFLLSTFNLVFSAGIGYWHLANGLKDEGRITFLILIFGGLFMKLAFIFNRDIKVWKEAKAIFLLCLIPFFTAFSLSFADLIFTVKISKNKSYIRPWTHTRMVYLVESLALAFPQAVYQSLIMVEDPNSLITLKGMITLLGLGILVYSMAFARIRYDSVNRPNRFGSGLEKVLRSVIIGSHKGLWIVTYVCAFVAARIEFHSNPPLTVLVTFGILLVLLELPILISTFRIFESLVVRFSWMFFMIPQFVFLVALIYWVNVDRGLYETNVGVCLLGAASLFESIVLMGWLLDTCNDRDADIMPNYPYFLGDLWNRTDKNRPLDS